MFDLCNGHKRPRPLHILNGMEVFMGVSIGHDLDRVSEGHIRIDIRALHHSPSVLHYVSVVLSLSNGRGPDSFRRFLRYTVTYFAEKLHAINLPIRRYG